MPHVAVREIKVHIAATPRSPQFVEALGRELTSEEIRHLQWAPKAARIIKAMRSGVSAELIPSEAGIDTSNATEMLRMRTMLVAWGRA